MPQQTPAPAEKPIRPQRVRRLLGVVFGARAIQRTGRAIRADSAMIRDAGRVNLENTAELDDPVRHALARRVQLEGIVYAGVAFLGVLAFIGFGRHTPGIERQVMGLAALICLVYASGILVLRFWQAHNVRYAQSLSLLQWLGLRTPASSSVKDSMPKDPVDPR